MGRDLFDKRFHNIFVFSVDLLTCAFSVFVCVLVFPAWLWLYMCTTVHVPVCMCLWWCLRLVRVADVAGGRKGGGGGA